jgi:hypothetical protein
VIELCEKHISKNVRDIGIQLGVGHAMHVCSMGLMEALIALNGEEKP